MLHMGLDLDKSEEKSLISRRLGMEKCGGQGVRVQDC